MQGFFGRATTRVAGIAIGSVTMAGALVAVAPASFAAPGDQPLPGHSALVPGVPRADTPRISAGEIWDMEVIGNRAYIAGSFSSLANTTGNTASVTQRYLAAFNLDTGQIDMTFRPNIAGGGVSAVEASPDGSKLYIGGTFKTVNGVAKTRLAALNPATGAPLAGFTATPNNAVESLDATNTTLYVGGRFTKMSGQDRGALAAVNGTTGAVDPAFNIPVTGGIGISGTLSVRQVLLTPDNSKLVVMHTGRQMAGQDRYGVGIIDTATKSLNSWKTRLWQDGLPLIGGIQKLTGGAISPDGSFFVGSSADGGDRPPLSDTAIAMPINDTSDDVQPLWINRSFDSIYSVAISEQAVYIGGHFRWVESPSSPDPWPGLDNVGYGTGQGLSGYSLGDAVVRRDQVAAISLDQGKSLEWNPGSNAFEGVKALKACPQGLLVGGDGMIQGGLRTGRVGFYDLRRLDAPTAVDTTITAPIHGRVVVAGQSTTITGMAKATGSSVDRVQVEIFQKDSKRYLQDDGTSWGKSNWMPAVLGEPQADGWVPWSLPVTIAGNQNLEVRARTRSASGVMDPTKATKRWETFGTDDETPSTNITAPTGSVLTTTTFTISGTASDDHGVESIRVWVRDASLNYLQADGSLSSDYATFRVEPDVPGAASTTWRTEVTVPHEGEWKAMAIAVDSTGQADLRGGGRVWNVTTSGVAPTVTVSSPVTINPPTAALPLTVAPGSPMTFAGTATDDQSLRSVEVRLRNATTGESLAIDGTWAVDSVQAWYQVSPNNMNQSTYNWTYTTPFALSPGIYTFQVRATDDLGLVTTSSLTATLTFTAQVAGDAFPNGLLNFTGTDQSPETLHLDITGTATDDIGVSAVKVALQDSLTRRYVQPNGTLSASFAALNATVDSPGATSTTFTLPVDLPAAGNYGVTAWAVDTSGQQDTSTSGATARYLVFPGDADPYLSDTLRAPVDGASFTEGKIFVSGRAFDDVAMAAVNVAIQNSTGLYLQSNGTFTTTERYVSSFLTSPGTPGSQYAYTSPVLAPGTYTVLVRPVDNNGQYPLVSPSAVVTVTVPASNTAPVAAMTVSCAENVCTFDGRGTTDENTGTVTYAWNFGNGRTATGAVVTTTYFAPGTFSAVLTAKDEYGAIGTATQPVTIVEPVANVAPSAVITTPACAALVCNISGATSTDPNLGDVVSYSWNWGDNTALGTSATMSHTYAAAGTYTITLTTRDGWGKTSTSTTTVTVG